MPTSSDSSLTLETPLKEESLRGNEERVVSDIERYQKMAAPFAGGTEPGVDTTVPWASATDVNVATADTFEHDEQIMAASSGLAENNSIQYYQDEEVYDSIHFQGRLNSPISEAFDEGHFTLTKYDVNTEYGRLVSQELHTSQGSSTSGNTASLERDLVAPERQEATHLSASRSYENMADAAQDPNSVTLEEFQATNNIHDNIQPAFTFEGSDQNGAVSASEWQQVADFLSDEPGSASVPLLQWIEAESKRSSVDKKRSVIRRLTVGYGIGKLLESPGINRDYCTMNNFTVHESPRLLNAGNASESEVVSIDMIEPSMSVRLVTTPFIPSDMEAVDYVDAVQGRDVSATVVGEASSPTVHQRDEKGLCSALGAMLHALFSGNQNSCQSDISNSNNKTEYNCDNDAILVRPLKKPSPAAYSETSFMSLNSTGTTSKSTGRQPCHNVSSVKPPSFIEYQCPPSISRLVRDLLSCDDELFCSDASFKCLKDATGEMHLLLEEPNLLFERAMKTHQGKYLLPISDKLFGRSLEMSKILEAYHRVASTGRSECVMIGADSGCGKTRLVRQAMKQVKFAEDYVVERKFEQVSTQSALTVVLSAIDHLCLQIASTKSSEHLNNMYSNLVKEFGMNVHFLSSLVPNVLQLFTPQANMNPTPSYQFLSNNVNYSSLCYTLQRLVLILVRTAGPCVIFLDDLQWADDMSLGVVRAILHALDDSGPLLFVGSYRNNEADSAQKIFDFGVMLSRLNAQLTSISLDCIGEDDVNLMISDILGIVPRATSSLSSVVYRKTSGSPFFIREFLLTLVDNNLVTYSLREKCWTWDIDKIGAEPITENVLQQLVTLKMRSLTKEAQTALKIASCFGIKIHDSIVEALSGSPQHSNLQLTFEDLVRQGFVDFDGVHFRFVHDKVKQSAYDLIGSDDRARHHFEIGMALYSCVMSQDEDDDRLFTIIEQINYGVPSMLSCQSERISIAKLNYRAGQLAMKRWNYVGALTYMKAAYSLLPEDSWEIEYTLSLNVYFQLAKAAYPSGEIDLAIELLNAIHRRGKCLDDKLDAYFLLVSSLHHEQHDLQIAFDICCNTLKALGVNVPMGGDVSTFRQLTELAKSRLNISLKSDQEVLSWADSPRRCRKDEEIMRFYKQLIVLSFTKGDREARLRNYTYFSSRCARFLIENKVVCKYTPICLAYYAAIWVYGFSVTNWREGYRLGKIAMKYLNQDGHEQELSGTYMMVYGFIAVMFEPTQACVEQHRRAYEQGMQVGNTTDAVFNLYFLIPRMIECGTNLHVVKKEIELYQDLAKFHSHSVLPRYMQWYMDTVSLLIDSGSSDQISPVETEECKITDATAIHIVQLIMPALYLGHYERVIFLAKKFESLQEDEKNKFPIRATLISFYHGLAVAGVYRRNQKSKPLLVLRNAISTLSKVSEVSSWNFRPKLLLLQAEMHSIKNKKSDSMYDDAIKAAQSSKFVHDEALACELAGKHFGRCKNLSKALLLYKQAERCYRDWGSEKKANQMKELIGNLS